VPDCPLPGIVIEPLTPSHAESMFPGLCDVRGYTFLAEEPPEDVAALRARYAFLAGGGSPDGREVWLNWAIRSEIGLLGYTQATLRGDRALIGYHVFPSFWRQGVGRRAVSLMLQAVQKRGDIAIAEALVDTRNVASAGLLRYLGFHWVETVRNADFFKGQHSDEYRFERLFPPFNVGERA